MLASQSLQAIPSVLKCADFKPIKYENFDELLIGRWNLVRMYGVPTLAENERDTCVCGIGSPTEIEHEISIQILDTRYNGGIQNLSAVGVRVKNGILDLSLDKEVDAAGIKITIRIHIVVRKTNCFLHAIFNKFYLLAIPSSS